MAFKDNSIDVFGLEGTGIQGLDHIAWSNFSVRGSLGWNELVRPLWKSWNAHIL